MEPDRWRRPMRTSRCSAPDAAATPAQRGADGAANATRSSVHDGAALVAGASPDGAPAFARDEVVAPMRVQQANGGSVVMPVRYASAPAVACTPIRRIPASDPATALRTRRRYSRGASPGQAGNLHGWSGFNGWRGY